jgi:hypothetical protein
MIPETVISSLEKEFNAAIGQRGRFEDLFKDAGKERGGWVHRPWEILDSDLPEKIETRVSELKKRGTKTLGFVAMGGESSIIGQSTENLINISSTAPAKWKRVLAGRNLNEIQWMIVSKSGSTKETKSNAGYLETCYRQVGLDPKFYLTYFTDPGTSLEQEKTQQGFRVERRELKDQTTVGGRNTLVNTPTLLAYTWRNPGRLRSMLKSLTTAHQSSPNHEDRWIKAAAEATSFIKEGRRKLALILPPWLNHELWIWLQQNPEESLGKHGRGFTVYTTRPDLATLSRTKDTKWVFIEFRLADQENQTKEYAEQVRQKGHPLVTIEVSEKEKNFIPQVVSYGWMKFVAAVGALWEINFSDQPPVEEYKKLMREKQLQLDDAIIPAGNAVVKEKNITLVYDGLLPFLTPEQQKELEKLKPTGTSAAGVYLKLLEMTRSKLDAQALAYYDDTSPKVEKILEGISQEILHKKLGYAAKWGEGTGVLHGLFVNWYSGPLHQIAIHIVATDHEQPNPSYPEGSRILKEGAVAAHRSLVEAKRPSVMLIVHGKLDQKTSGKNLTFWESVIHLL